MAQEDDPLDDLRSVGMTTAAAATRVVEAVARSAQEQARRQAYEGERAAAEYQRRLQAEAVVAEQRFAITAQPQWLTQAAPRELADAWRDVQQWRQVDERRFAPFADALTANVRERYGLDLDLIRNLAGADGVDVAAHTVLARAEREQGRSTATRPAPIELEGRDQPARDGVTAETRAPNQADESVAASAAAPRPRPGAPERAVEDLARRERVADLLREAWPEQAAEKVIAGRAFGAAAWQLERLERAGQDPRQVLAAIRSGEVTDRRIQHPAAFLAWRLDQRAAGIGAPRSVADDAVSGGGGDLLGTGRAGVRAFPDVDVNADDPGMPSLTGQDAQALQQLAREDAERARADAQDERVQARARLQAGHEQRGADHDGAAREPQGTAVVSERMPPTGGGEVEPGEAVGATSPAGDMRAGEAFAAAVVHSDAAAELDVEARAYDTAERRAATERAMAAAGVPEEDRDAVMTADHLNASDPRRAAQSAARAPGTRGPATSGARSPQVKRPADRSPGRAR